MWRGSCTQRFRANVSGCKVAVSEDFSQLEELRPSNAKAFALSQVTGFFSYLMVMHPSQETALIAIWSCQHRLWEVSLRATNFGRRISALNRK